MLPWSSLFSERVSNTLQTIESWISSIFFILFLLTIGPWFLFLAYDLLLYLFRTAAHEIPFIGGRARGKERPRAPSLKERPSGDPRVIGIGVPGAGYVEEEDVEEERRRSGVGTPGGEGFGGVNEKLERGRAQVVTDIGFSPDRDDEEEGRLPKILSIGGQDERLNWTEVNARRRMGFKDDEGPG